RLMDAVNWHGFGMFDIKIHEQTGMAYFLEMNPRLGRHHYYLTVAGANPATYLYREVVARDAHPSPLTVDGPAASLTIPMKLAQQDDSTDRLNQLRTGEKWRRLARPLSYPTDRNIKRGLYQRYRLCKAAAEVEHSPGTMNA